MKNAALSLGILISISMVLSGCSNNDTEGSMEGTPRTCEFEQPHPYASGSTYVGVHGNRENNDRIYCSGPSIVMRSWEALEGTLTQQPVSFTDDGTAVLVTIARTEGCNLYAIDTETGEGWGCAVPWMPFEPILIRPIRRCIPAPPGSSSSQSHFIEPAA